MLKRRKIMAAMVTCLMAVMMFGGTALASAEYDHGFTIMPSGQKSWDVQGGKYRPATTTADPWGVMLGITTDPHDYMTVFWIENNANGARLSNDVYVQHGGYHYNNPYAGANQTTIRLTARDNRTDNNSYWIGGKWRTNTWF